MDLQDLHLLESVTHWERALLRPFRCKRVLSLLFWLPYAFFYAIVPLPLSFHSSPGKEQKGKKGKIHKTACRCWGAAVSVHASSVGLSAPAEGPWCPATLSHCFPDRGIPGCNDGSPPRQSLPLCRPLTQPIPSVRAVPHLFRHRFQRKCPGLFGIL